MRLFPRQRVTTGKRVGIITAVEMHSDSPRVAVLFDGSPQPETVYSGDVRLLYDLPSRNRRAYDLPNSNRGRVTW